jgi:hypothetical protein
MRRPLYIERIPSENAPSIENGNERLLALLGYYCELHAALSDVKERATSITMRKDNPILAEENDFLSGPTVDRDFVNVDETVLGRPDPK